MQEYCELIFIDDDEEEETKIEVEIKPEIKPETKRCSRCLVNLTMNFFNKKRMGYTKACSKCLETAKRLRDRTKCEHNKRKARCRICDGSAFCEHNIQKEQCRICGGSSFCEHYKRKSNCRICKPPKEILIRNWLANSIKADRKHDKYNPEKFITKSFLSDEFDRCISSGASCWYCDKKMNLIDYRPDFITLERLNNEEGHNTDNCVFACFSCNLKHKSKTFHNYSP